MKRKPKNAPLFNETNDPTDSGWDTILYPDLGDPKAYALEVSGKTMLPVYRAKDMLIVSPAAKLKRGCRVVVRLRGGDVWARTFLRRGRAAVTVEPVAGGKPQRITLDRIEAVHKVVAATF